MRFTICLLPRLSSSTLSTRIRDAILIRSLFSYLTFQPSRSCATLDHISSQCHHIGSNHVSVRDSSQLQLQCI